MSPKDRSRPVDESGSDKTSATVHTIIGPTADNLPGYVVIMVTRFGMLRRKVYLDLGHARAAVERTRKRGLHAELILCELRPVAGDLGEVAE